jgi:hypothetical protein
MVQLDGGSVKIRSDQMLPPLQNKVSSFAQVEAMEIFVHTG